MVVSPRIACSGIVSRRKVGEKSTRRLLAMFRPCIFGDPCFPLERRDENVSMPKYGRESCSCSHRRVVFSAPRFRSCISVRVF